MILMIDNFDSFTFNIVQYLKQLGEAVYTIRNDDVTFDFIRQINPKCIFISPGPKAPIDAGQCVNVIREFKGKIPIFGVCLGHQCIGEAFGGEIIHAKKMMHGKNSIIKTTQKGIFKNFSKCQFTATRYHSLVINKENLPDCLEITCVSDDGEIMGVKHKEYNIEGVQFHPEAILTEGGHEMFKIFLDSCNYKSTSGKHLIKDNTSFQPAISSLKQGNIKLSLKQRVVKGIFNDDFYTNFLKLYNSGNEFKECVFFDSAGGPARDCSFSMIGLFPQFNIEIKGHVLKLRGKNKKFIDHLNRLLSINFKKIDEGFDIGEAKFSLVFELIKNSFVVQKEHTDKFKFSLPLIGYFSYEYLHYLEDVPRKNSNPVNLPDIDLYFYSVLILSEYGMNKFEVVNNTCENESKEDTLIAKIVSCFQNKSQNELEDSQALLPISSEKFTSKQNVSKDQFVRSVKQAIDYLKDGHIFQVQLGVREIIEGDYNSIQLYNELRELNPSPYMFYFNTLNYQIISNSPELQFSIIDRNAMIRPIAGTSKGKGHNEESKKIVMETFKNDVKEKAEHIMLVDLARNDIGRMAIAGTVRVEELMCVEEYSNLFHLTSTVVGKLQNGLNSMELFECTFPAGTLTGAPKIRAMEIISELETEQRGPYGGAMGIFDFNGNIKSCIIIRSIIKKQNKLYIQASAGIVADSTPENEWTEIKNKLMTAKKAIANIKSS